MTERVWPLSLLRTPILGCALLALAFTFTFHCALVVLVVVGFGIILASQVAVVVGNVINTFSWHFRFTLAIIHLVKDQAVNYSVATGRATPLMFSAEISRRRLEVEDIGLTAFWVAIAAIGLFWRRG